MSLPRRIISCRGGLVTIVLCGLLASSAAIPTASAAGPDGSYKLVNATHTLNLGGGPLNLDQEMIKNLIGAAKGKIVVSQSQIKIDRQAAGEAMEQLGAQYGFQLEASIAGPKSLTLQKSGTAYVGKTTKPVVITVKVYVGDQVMTGKIRSHFKIKIKGKTLLLDMPVAGDLVGMSLNGQVKATCKKR